MVNCVYDYSNVLGFRYQATPRDTPDPMSSVVDLGWGHAAGKVKSHNYVKSETFTSPGGTEE